ncbi:hypothetical protein ANA_C10174 [Anabaena sp. 90]|nr:hypothetical protein ANA_C10174 [Anabaena sp. 90]
MKKQRARSENFPNLCQILPYNVIDDHQEFENLMYMQIFG